MAEPAERLPEDQEYNERTSESAYEKAQSKWGMKDSSGAGAERGGGAHGSGANVAAKKSQMMDDATSKLTGGKLNVAPISGKHGGQKDLLNSDNKAAQAQGQKNLAKNVEHTKGGAGAKIAKANQQGGTKAAAGEAVRQGAKKGFEQGAQAAADAATGGAAEAARPVIKAASKALEWLSRDKRWLKLGIVILIPNIIIWGLIIYIIQAPLDFITKIADVGFSKFREIAGSAITGAGYSTEVTINDLNEKMKGIAANDIAGLMPEQGTIRYKLLQIDASKLESTTLKSGIPFKIATKSIPGPGGKNYTVLDTITNTKTGKSYSVKDLAKPDAPAELRNVMGTVLASKIPIFNMIIRNPQARKFNQNPDLKLALNYAESKENSTELNKPYDQLKEYLRKKTFKRVRGANIVLPNVSSDNSTESELVDKKIVESIKKAQDDLTAGTDPQELKIDLPYDNYGPDGLSPRRISVTLCSFNTILLAPQNIASSIESRANAARRDGAKFMTLRDSNNKGVVNSGEMKYSFNQLSDYAKSNSYSRVVYGKLAGVAVEPDGISQAAMAITRDKEDLSATEILQKMTEVCGSLKDLEEFRAQNGSSATPGGTGGFFGFFRDQFNLDIYFREIRAAGITQKMVEDTNSMTDLPKGTCFPDQPGQTAQCYVYALRLAIRNNWFNRLQSEIYRGSDGFYKQKADVTPEDITEKLIRVGAGASVTGLEDGNQNFARFIQGTNQLNFDYLQSYGGRFLTDQENSAISVAMAKVRDWETKNYGIGFRLFDTNNVSSLASRMMHNVSPDPQKTIANFYGGLASSILNPIRSLASIDDITSYVVKGESNIAQAADSTVYNDAKYSKISPTGFVDKETAIDWLNNADLIESLKKNSTKVADPDPLQNGAKVDANTLFTKWNNCFISKISSEYYFEDAYLDALKKAYESTEEINGAPKYSDADKAEYKRKYELYKGCKPVLSSSANDVNSLQVQYRVYHLRSLILDSLGSLSSDAQDDSIYAKTTTSDTTADPGTGGGGTGANITDKCPEVPGVTSAGVGEKHAYGGALQYTMNLCKVQGITVSVTMALKLNNLLNAAKADGITMSGWGYRSYERQKELRIEHGCPDFSKPSSTCSPPTARPGESNHESGEAVDFTYGGSTLTRGSAAFRWMTQKAGAFGFINLPSEAWHWSKDGG